MSDNSNTTSTRVPGFEDEFFPLTGFPGYLISREGTILSRRTDSSFREIGLNGKTITVRVPGGGYKRLWIRTLLRSMFPDLEEEAEDSTMKTGRGSLEAWRVDSGQVRERSCLGCGRTFLSNGPWNRNCGCIRRKNVSVQRTHGARIAL